MKKTARCGPRGGEFGPYLHFYTTNHNHIAHNNNENLYKSEVSWGDTDLEWVALFTCSFLQGCGDGAGGVTQQCKEMGSGVRMILGFKDVMLQLPDAWQAERFIYYITRKRYRLNIKDAWLKMCAIDNRKDNPADYQPGKGVVIFGEDARDDHLPGYGSYAVGNTFTLNRYEEEK